MKKASWILIGIMATLIGLYPLIYFLVDRRFGLLASKSAALLSDTVWNIAFYGHIRLCVRDCSPSSPLRINLSF
tara:strand:- start:176 stop:397 length:222 start_codon:yes stop_codon:yes gene_type:complete